MGRTTVNTRDPEVLKMKKSLFVFLLGMSSLAQGQIVDLDCEYTNGNGQKTIDNITVDLDKKTFKNGDEFFTHHQVEITEEFVSAQKFDRGTVTFSATHQISRVTLSYVYVFGLNSTRNRFEGQCEIVTRKRAF